LDAIKDFNFWAIVAYLLPGLFIGQARNVAAHGQLAPITKDSLVGYLIVTVVYALFLWTLGVALQSSSSISGLDPGVLFKYFVICPIVVGFVYGLLERYWIIQRFLTPFGINAPLPFASVFSEILPHQQAGTYVIVVLKVGTRYNGLIPDDSRFSSNPEKCDLYLGQTYSLNDWIPSNPRRGVYISGSEICSIEIISPT